MRLTIVLLQMPPPHGEAGAYPPLLTPAAICLPVHTKHIPLSQPEKSNISQLVIDAEPPTHPNYNIEK